VSFGAEAGSEVESDEGVGVEIGFGFGFEVEKTLSSSGDAVGISLFCWIRAER